MQINFDFESHKVNLPSLSLERIESSDAKHSSDALRHLVNLLHESEDMYPGIRNWARDKVIPGLRDNSRVAYIGYLNEKPVLSAVVKKGLHAKFCHLKISEKIQGERLGQLLFSLMAFDVRREAKEIHFTLPESLWLSKRDFFNQFAFFDSTPNDIQYRLFDNELRCSAPWKDVWNNILNMVPRLLTSYSISGYDFNDGVVLSIRDSHAKAIVEGEKTVEIRTRFSKRWIGCRASIVATGQLSGLIGEALIADVVQDTPDIIWDRYSNSIGCEKNDYDNYVGDKENVYALLLENPRQYMSVVPLTQLTHLTNENLKPPQSYCSISKSDAWTKAISVAAMLHASRSRNGVISSTLLANSH